MSGSYKTATFEILKQPNSEEMSHYLLQSPEGVQHEGEGTRIFTEQQKVCCCKEAHPADRTIDVMFQLLKKKLCEGTQ